MNYWEWTIIAGENSSDTTEKLKGLAVILKSARSCQSEFENSLTINIYIYIYIYIYTYITE